MQILTEKQNQILNVIRKAIEQVGNAPTVREIGALVNLSSSCTVKKHLDSLEAKGYIKRDRYKRSISLMEDGAPVAFGRSVCVPLLGRVAGGAPILAEQFATPEMLPLPLSLLRRGDETGRDLFALEVCGNSMRDAGIADGDIVVARKQETASDGDIVVALIGEEATVKTFYRENGGVVRLQPENPEYEPIFTEDVSILGKVAMAIKRFD
jgi:repressor LexA